MLKNITKTIIINVIIICLVFISMELIFRALYPEFHNQVHSKSITYGKNVYFGKFMGMNVRVPYAGYKIEINEQLPLLLIIGDSITNGYGSAYEDIYWEKLARLLNVTTSSKMQIIGLGGAGNNFSDGVIELELLLAKKSDRIIPIKYVMYQFNFNDITPYGNSELKAGKHLKGFEHTPLFKRIAVWRYQYLNKSVFLRVMQYYAGVWKLKTKGTCEERGYDALKEYTWSFGSKPFQAESKEQWKTFENSMERLKKICDKIHAKCIIFISPTLYDIDHEMKHHYIKNKNLDFRCATINPRKQLEKIAYKLKIDIIDPKDYLREHFKNRLLENNFEPFYFAGDDNHFTPVASQYIAEFLCQYFIKLSSK